MKRLTRTVKGGSQVELFDGVRRTPGETGKRETIVFHDGDPRDLFVGTERLDRYLATRGGEWILEFRKVLREMDWKGFTDSYVKRGRPPYHPASMMGLILYGTMMGRHSLRDLERLAQLDVGAMWLSGGMQPDHSCVGRFIQTHEELLTERFFEDTTRLVLRRLGSKATVLAGDGTVVEAAGSRFRMMKQEAARQAAEEAARRAAESPKDEELKHEAERAAVVATAADQRVEARRNNGDPVGKVEANAVCRTDPEAPLLKTKRGAYSPAYVSSALADEDRLIVAVKVLPSSEADAVGPMLDQANRVAGPVEAVVFDGNYCNGTVMNAASEHEVSVVCPPKPDRLEQKERKAFAKADFRYDSEKDTYLCPAGNELPRTGTGKKNAVTFTRYTAGSKTCRNCPLRDKCLLGTQTRRDIQRFETDEFREALQITNAHSRATLLMKRRKVMIEPVFSVLRGVQKLSRFHRWGLAGAQVEFSIHATAYNVRRMLTLLARRAVGGAAHGLTGTAVQAVCRLILALLMLLKTRKPARRDLLPFLAAA